MQALLARVLLFLLKQNHWNKINTQNHLQLLELRPKYNHSDFITNCHSYHYHHHHHHLFKNFPIYVKCACYIRQIITKVIWKHCIKSQVLSPVPIKASSLDFSWRSLFPSLVPRFLSYLSPLSLWETSRRGPLEQGCVFPATFYMPIKNGICSKDRGWLAKDC